MSRQGTARSRVGLLPPKGGERANRARPRLAESGFSLLEMMCVLAIIGVAAGAAMLAAGGRDGSVAVRAEALRLADRLSLAADEALVGGEAVALDLDTDGYVFLAWSDEKADWAPHRLGLLGLRHAAPAGVAFSSAVKSDEPLPIDPGQGAAAELLVAGRGAAWRVAFDGLTARAAPVDRERAP